MNEKSSDVVDSFRAWLMRHRYLSIVVLVGTIVIGLGTFTDSLEKLCSFAGRVLSPITSRLTEPDVQAGLKVEMWPMQGGGATQIPTDPPLASTIAARDFFDYSRIFDTPILSDYRDTPLLVLWSGYVKVVSEGPHLFLCEIEYGWVGRHMRHNVFVRVDVGDETIFEDVSPDNFNRNDIMLDKSLDFEPGYKKIKVWIAVGDWQSPSGFQHSELRENLKFTLKLKQPGQATAMPLTKKELFCEA